MLAAVAMPVAAAPTARAPRLRSATVVCSAAPRPRGQPQPQEEDGLDRRALLMAVGAALAGAAVQQVQPAAAAADACTFSTASNGLQWCDLVEGSGAAPAAGTMIRAHYTGRLASNGAVFDSSYERRRPLEFKVGVGQVIKGWDQGIVGTGDVPPMKEGGKRRLIIPAELGYGARGAGGRIPANADLDFVVELLGKRRMG